MPNSSPDIGKDVASPEEVTDNSNNDNTFKILLATDCHLGYEEKMTDSPRNNDSFVTFEEILRLGAEKNVDFILLGGDLFHDSKPSQNAVFRCINLLKKYCLGNRDIKFGFLTEPSEVLSTTGNTVNYEDENLNVSIPVFTIHGNHDNPSFEYTSTIDVLAATGLVNYFGKSSNLDEVTVMPMVFKKGSTYVAIYGISYIGEQRLSRLFNQERVKFLRPNGIDNCFNILVLHQNRAKHTRNGFIADDKLPSFFDLVFWGHEHECRITPEYIKVDDSFYHVTQPGSSVATSLCEGEAKPKHVGILNIKGQNFHLEEVKLQTVRPFIHDTISLPTIIREEYCLPTPDGICEYVDDYIENTIFPQLDQLRSDHPDQPTIPLIRLKLLYTEDSQRFDTMNIIRKYCDRVANPKDILLFRKERITDRSDLFDADDPAAALAECFRHTDGEHDWSFTVQNGIQKYFQENNCKLNVLSLLGMNEALNRCVQANDDDAFASVIQHQIGKTLDYFKGRKVELTQERYREEIQAYQRQRASKTANDEIAEVNRVLDNTQSRPKAVVTIDSDNEEEMKKPATRGRGRGSRGPRASTRAQTTTGRGRAAKSALDITTTPTTDNIRSRFTQRSSQPNVSSSIQASKTAGSSQFFQDVSDSDSD